MTTPNDGGPAFPTFGFIGSLPTGEEEYEHKGGMSLRDYLAAKAMQGLLTNDPINSKWLSSPNQRDRWVWLADDCYSLADAMIERRKELIVRAVNSFDSLLKACKGLLALAYKSTNDDSWIKLAEQAIAQAESEG